MRHAAELATAPEPQSAPPVPLIAGGSLMIAAGLAAVIYSGIKLNRNTKTRQRVCGSHAPSGLRIASAKSTATSPPCGR